MKNKYIDLFDVSVLLFLFFFIYLSLINEGHVWPEDHIYFQIFDDKYSKSNTYLFMF